jgi:peptidoglycan/xylan/chitin deacetylase (PgdA/CDA1 family)
MTRFVSFRFDDSFIVGARKAERFLFPNRATFFVVSGLINGTLDLKEHPNFEGQDFGSLGEWRAFAKMGHDIQAHSATHTHFSKLSPEQRKGEIRESVALIRQIHGGPYVFCFPYNDIAPVDFKSEGVSAAGFRTNSSDREPPFNRISKDLDLFELRSWSVRERHFVRVVSDLRHAVPDATWTILAFHSLDGEGHEPWTSDGFERLVEAVRSMGYVIVTVAQMIYNLKNAPEALPGSGIHREIS